MRSILADHKVVICAGSGGVGKTTTAASLAVSAALAGRRTVVMTIDPAKRLANSLGLDGLGSSPSPVVHAELGRGTLSAMMLDQKGAWDRMVEKHAPNEEARTKILANRFYQNLSQSFAGSQEYMAIEQLCDLYDGGDYDLIVVDTPPTRHALDFLEAPQRLADFLDRDVIKWFVKPYFSAGWSTMRIVNRTAGVLFRRLEDATGIHALVEVSEFFGSMNSLFEGFEQRVRRVYDLLRSRETAFVLVATPEEQVLREARTFAHQVGDLGMELRGVVFNRVHQPSARTSEREQAVMQLVQRLGDAEAARRLWENFERYERVARADARRIEAFVGGLRDDVAVAQVPNFDSDVFSVDGLRSMHPYLLESND